MLDGNWYRLAVMRRFALKQEAYYSTAGLIKCNNGVNNPWCIHGYVVYPYQAMPEKNRHREDLEELERRYKLHKKLHQKTPEELALIQEWCEIAFPLIFPVSSQDVQHIDWAKYDNLLPLAFFPKHCGRDFGLSGELVLAEKDVASSWGSSPWTSSIYRKFRKPNAKLHNDYLLEVAQKANDFLRKLADKGY